MTTSAEYHRRYRAKHADKIRARNRERMRRYREADPEGAKAYARAYRLAHLEHSQEKSRAWNRTHPEKMREIGVQYRARHGEKHRQVVRQWVTENAAATRLHAADRRARQASATPQWLTREQRRQMRALYEEAERTGMTVDHIVPVRGRNVCGLHVPWNLQLLTAAENCRKGNRHQP